MEGGQKTEGQDSATECSWLGEARRGTSRATNSSLGGPCVSRALRAHILRSFIIGNRNLMWAGSCICPLMRAGAHGWNPLDLGGWRRTFLCKIDSPGGEEDPALMSDVREHRGLSSGIPAG